MMKRWNAGACEDFHHLHIGEGTVRVKPLLVRSLIVVSLKDVEQDIQRLKEQVAPAVEMS